MSDSQSKHLKQLSLWLKLTAQVATVAMLTNNGAERPRLESVEILGNGMFLNSIHCN